MRTPDLSVLLPVRNGAATLAEAVESVRRQTGPSWELVIVNDGSTDDSASLLDHLAREDPRVRVRHQPAAGLVAALQTALREARAAVLARMDADDVSLPGRFAAQFQALAEHPAWGLVGCRVRFGGDRTRQLGYALHVDWLNSLLEPESIRLARFVESPLAHPSVMFRRECVERFGGYRAGAFPEDYELWLRWLDQAVPMAKVEGEFLVWNDSPGRLSRCDARYAAAAFYALKADYLARELHRTRQGRALWIWGAGRLTRRRAEALEAHGLQIAGFIDIDPRKTRQRPGARPVILPDQLPPPQTALVVVYVARRGARELIRAALRQRGYAEGQDYWLAG